jgi:ribonuclease HI
VWGWRRNGWRTAAGGEVLNRELWQRLFDLVGARPPKSLEWRWVRGHVGTPGNERADEIAVAFALQKPANLYRGPLTGYSVDIHTVPENTALPKRDVSSTGTKARSKAARIFLPERGGRRADASYELDRMRASREGAVERALQESHERRR